MRFTRPFGTIGRVLGRLGKVGLFGGMIGIAAWYGCAGSNTDYAGNPVDGGSGGDGDGGPSGPPDLLCVKMPGEDLPDDLGLDTDCDAIDGNRNNSIFVAVSGSDMNLGTIESPFLTIGKAITVAKAQQKHAVLVSKGVYTESVTLQAGVGIYGGYDADNQWIRLKSNVTTISSPTGTAITASGITGETHVDWVTIKSANGSTGTTGSPAGGSSYGVFVTNSVGPIHLRSDVIIAGNGGNGAAGTNGAVPVTGPGTNPTGNGAPGTNGVSNGSNGGYGGVAGTSACGLPGGAGGSGSRGNDGGSGAAAASNPGSGGGGGGASGFCGFNANGGGNGRGGSNGNNGVLGTQSAPAGTPTAGGFTPAGGGNGGAATSGTAGGGGGAGGGGVSDVFCNSDTGGGGGGGGAGGCAGNPGSGGGGGGASVGVYAFSSAVVVFNTAITTGQGGAGGNGGNGSAGSSGGAGGTGGSKADDAAAGGNGGTGGKGGDAGAGAGGTGGPSFGIWTVHLDLDQSSTGNTFPGSGGAGGRGNGGTSPLGQGYPGSAGISATKRYDP